MDFLVIDDDKTFRDATCFLIEDEGHYAEGVDSGQMGMNWLKDEKYDAVLLDMNLGPESGLDILTQIQKQNPQIPVVIITAQGSIQTAVEAMRRGGLPGKTVPTRSIRHCPGAHPAVGQDGPANPAPRTGSQRNAFAKH